EGLAGTYCNFTGRQRVYSPATAAETRPRGLALRFRLWNDYCFDRRRAAKAPNTKSASVQGSGTGILIFAPETICWFAVSPPKKRPSIVVCTADMVPLGSRKTAEVVAPLVLTSSVGPPMCVP